MIKNNVTPAAEQSRDEKMNQLLDQMTELFLTAFPTAESLVEWLSEVNPLVWESKGDKYADDAAAFIWGLQFDILPDAIAAKSDEEMTQIVKGALRHLPNRSTGKPLTLGLAFICHRMRLEQLELKYEPKDRKRVLALVDNLDGIVTIGREYSLFVEEDQKEWLKALEAEQLQHACQRLNDSIRDYCVHRSE